MKTRQVGENGEIGMHNNEKKDIRRRCSDYNFFDVVKSHNSNS